MVRCPHVSVCLSHQTAASAWVGLLLSGRQAGDIDRQLPAPALSSNGAGARRLAAFAGSVMLPAEGRGWIQICCQIVQRQCVTLVDTSCHQAYAVDFPRQCSSSTILYAGEVDKPTIDMAKINTAQTCCLPTIIEIDRRLQKLQKNCPRSRIEVRPTALLCPHALDTAAAITIQYNTKFVKRHVTVASEALANRTVKKHRRRRTNVL